MMSLDLSVQGDVRDSLSWQMEFFVPIPHSLPLESDPASHLHHFVSHSLYGGMLACVRAWVSGCMGACVHIWNSFSLCSPGCPET